MSERDDDSHDDAGPGAKATVPGGVQRVPQEASAGAPPPEVSPPTPMPAGVASVPVEIDLQTLDRKLYDVGAEFARGGLGRILRARDRRLNRTVALKELHFQHPAAEARFVREAQVTARLQHPNIIPVHEAGRWPSGEPFYAMKLVDGRPLTHVINACKTPADRLRVVTVIADVADAIAYAHTQGIIHRDLKPDNVLVGQFGETVVIDWGLAKDLNAPEPSPADALTSDRGEPPNAYSTTDGVVMGTPAYMPPEQAAGETVDETADVYALGAMLYELVAGQRPYADRGKVNLVKVVTKEPPTALGRLAPDTPPDLLAIVDKAMHRDRSRRYPSAREMAEELDRFRAGRMVGAYHYSSWDLVSRFVRRQRAAVSTGLVALAALVFSGALFVQRVTEERDRANLAREMAELRYDEVIIEEARTLLDIDPTQAAAVLKRLGVVRPQAASVGARVQDAGVAHRVLRGHEDQVRSVSASPDGRRVVSGGDDKRVIFWDLTDGEHHVGEGHTDRVTSVTFSFDGRWVASSSYDSTVRLWDAATFSSQQLSGHTGPVRKVAFSPVSDRFASIGEDDTVRLWTVDGGAPAVFAAPVDDRVQFVAFSPDGMLLLSGSHADRVRVWDADSGSSVELAGHDGPVHAAVFSPDGMTIATAGADGTVRLWTASGRLRRVIRVQNEAVTAVAFAPDGRHVASAGDDDLVRLHDVRTGKSRVVATHTERVPLVAFSPDGRYLASASWDKTVHLIDVQSRLLVVLRGHGQQISGLSFLADGRGLVSASFDGTLRHWRLSDASTAGYRVLTRHSVGVHAVAFSPNGRLVASGGHDNMVRLSDLETGEVRLLGEHTDHVYRVRFSPDGKWVASSSDDRSVRLWPVAGGRSVVLSGHTADVEELAFSPNGAKLASAAEDNTVRLWDLDTREAIELVHDNHATGVSFSPDGALLATGSRDHAVRLWNVESGELVRRLSGHTDEVRDVAFRPDGTVVASASTDGTVRLWDVSTGAARTIAGRRGARRVVWSPDGSRLAVSSVTADLALCDPSDLSCEPLAGHRATVEDMVFTPDGKGLVTGGKDATVRIWDVETLEHRVLSGHAAAVYDVAVSSDGKRVASASSDETVRLWPVRYPPRPDRLRSFLDDLTVEVVAGGDLPMP